MRDVAAWAKNASVDLACPKYVFYERVFAASSILARANLCVHGRLQDRGSTKLPGASGDEPEWVSLTDYAYMTNRRYALPGKSPATRQTRAEGGKRKSSDGALLAAFQGSASSKVRTEDDRLDLHPEL